MSRKKVQDMSVLPEEAEEIQKKVKHLKEDVDEKAEVETSNKLDLLEEEGLEENREKPKGKKAGKEKKPEVTEAEGGEIAEEPEPVKEHKSVKANIKKHVHGKKYKEAAKKVEKGKEYSLEEAIDLLKKTATPKFDSTVELHINLNVDPTNSDQQIRGSVILPEGAGKAKKVCAVVGSDKEKEAKEAGADSIGGQELIDKIEKGWLDFDVLVATPDMMGALGKIGRILGTKGLMPNPKAGTVTTDIGKIVEEIKKGRVEFRIDKQGIVHVPAGKVSFDKEKLENNIKTLQEAIHHSKPASVKGTFVKSEYLTTTMGPGIRLEK
jgi:large subunit ribosomal protein L1